MVTYTDTKIREILDNHGIEHHERYACDVYTHAEGGLQLLKIERVSFDDINRRHTMLEFLNY